MSSSYTAQGRGVRQNPLIRDASPRAGPVATKKCTICAAVLTRKSYTCDDCGMSTCLGCAARHQCPLGDDNNGALCGGMKVDNVSSDKLPEVDRFPQVGHSEGGAPPGLTLSKDAPQQNST